MIKIEAVTVQQTKGGLTVETEQVRADDWGMNQDGTYGGTVIGERIRITISTSILTKTQVRLINSASSNKAGINITFPHPSGEEKSMLFVKEGNQSWTFENQKRGKYAPTTLTFVSKEVI